MNYINNLKNNNQKGNVVAITYTVIAVIVYIVLNIFA